MVYAHYSLHTSTPILATRAEQGAYPTYIPGISCLTTNMSYPCSLTAPPLISKALLVQQATARSSKFSWWNNTWRILAPVNITPNNISNPPPPPLTLRTASKAHTAVGGSPNPTPQPPPNYPPSANSTHPSTQPHTLTQAHTTSAHRPSSPLFTHCIPCNIFILIIFCIIFLFC